MPRFRFTLTRFLSRTAACLLAAACASHAAAAPAVPGAAADPAKLEVVTVGVFTLAPFVVAGRDAPVGVLVDFFDHEIAPRMGVRFAWRRPMTTARLESSIIAGAVMFTPVFAKTPMRLRNKVRFVGEPYIKLDPCLAVLPDSPLTTVTSPADLAGISIGWVQAGALPSFMLDRRIKLDRIGSVEWTAANLEKLKVGRIGAAYFSNHYTPQYVAAQSDMEIRLIPLPTPGVPVYGAFAPTAARSLDERYRKAAAEAFADDRFARYLRRALVSDATAANLPRR